MKKHIHRYLDQYYYLYINSKDADDNNRIYLLREGNPVLVNIHHICADIKEIFGIEKNEFKWYLKSWCKKKNRKFTFKTYWTQGCLRKYENEMFKFYTDKLRDNMTNDGTYRPKNPNAIKMWNHQCHRTIWFYTQRIEKLERELAKKYESKEIHSDDIRYTTNAIEDKRRHIEFYKSQIV